MQITVVNRPGKGSNGAVYIGRGGRGLAGSPLANPRRLGDPKPDGGVWQRGETITLFEHDLRRVLDPALPSTGTDQCSDTKSAPAAGETAAWHAYAVLTTVGFPTLTLLLETGPAAR